MDQAIVHLHPQAPPKPSWAEPCNGCGVCCAYAPCPVGVLISKKVTGRCAALLWIEAESRYRCGALVDAKDAAAWPQGWLLALKNRVVRRMISAGSGCDCSLVVEQAREDGVKDSSTEITRPNNQAREP